MIILSGPCVIENKNQLESIARGLESIARNENIDFYFKASFDKANRTSLDSYRGVGLDTGLKMLEDIKKKFGYKIITDIHESHQAEAIAEVADMIQIPAFLCRQTDLIVSVARTKAKINIKKGQFMAPADMQYSVLKAMQTRDPKSSTANYQQSKDLGIYLTERGSSFGYHNLVVDFRSLIIMREFAPVIFDATHSVQMPGGGGGKSSGERKYATPLSRAAASIGVDGFFMETHTCVEEALSDGPNMIETKDMPKLVEDLLKLSRLKEEL